MSEFIKIPDHDGFYISKNGVVKRINKFSKDGRLWKDKVMTQTIGTTGYQFVNLSGKSLAVHRILAKVFIDNPDNKPEVNHKNGIRTDYRLENLEWVTREENQQHSWRDLGRIATWKNKDGHRHHASKPVNQYDVDGKFITQYGSLAQASIKNGWHPYSVQHAIDKRGGYYKGFYWTRANG